MTKIVVLLLFSFMTGLLAFMPGAIISDEAKNVRPDGVPDWIVAADGSGDFQTLQEAIDAVPVNNPKRVAILIKPGVYKAHVVIPKNKPLITLSGQDAEKTVLTNDLHQESIGIDGKKAGATGSATVVIYGADFRAQNITFENNAPRVAQALAIYVDADRALFRQCRFLAIRTQFACAVAASFLTAVLSMGARISFTARQRPGLSAAIFMLWIGAGLQLPEPLKSSLLA